MTSEYSGASDSITTIPPSTQAPPSPIPSGTSLSRLQDEYDQLLADHAWADDEDEMDYSFVPFSDSITEVVAAAAVVVEDDPVVLALRQRMAQEEMARNQDKQQAEIKARGNSAANWSQQETEVKPQVSHPPPVRSWRETAKPVVIEPEPPAPPIQIAKRTADPTKPSILDLLITSIKDAAHSHAHSPDADHRLLFFNDGPAIDQPAKTTTTTTTTATPFHYEPAKPDRLASTERIITIQLHASMTPIRTKFTVSTDPIWRTAPQSSRPPLDLTNRSINMSALRRR